MESAPIPSQTAGSAEPFVGRWNRLVSTTNWEKGRIIAEWRDTMAAAGNEPTEFSDEAWARIVSGVTGQHVGRLRRVWQRFGGVFESYEGLYWSHFHAALDWPDAEMWLEGAVQNRWSVSRMRRTRWETLGDPRQPEPREEEIVSGELDEDFEPALSKSPGEPLQGDYAELPGPRHDGPDFGDEEAEFSAEFSHASDRARATEREGGEREAGEPEAGEPETLVRPFENLPELPDDLADALENFKLALLRHKSTGWEAISEDDALRLLDSLRALVLAPSGETAPF